MHACLHKMYPQVFFEQKVLRLLAELNAIEITRITCARFPTCNFPLSLNRAVPYTHIYVAIC